MTQINQVLASHGGLALFLIGFAEQSGLPLPGAPFLLAAGALAAGGHLSLFTAICWAAFGSLAADTIWFYVGRHGKGRLFQLFPHLHAVRQRLDTGIQTPSILRGAGMLTAAKFLPFSTVAPLQAGALEVGCLRFVLVDGACSAVYACLYILPGFFLHDQLEQVAAFFQRLGVSTFMVLLVLAGGYLGYRLLKRRRPRLTSSTPSELTPEPDECVTPSYRGWGIND